MRNIGNKLFTENCLKEIFPFSKVYRKEKDGLWNVRIKDRAEAYLIFNILPHSKKIRVRHTATRFLSSVKIDRKNYLLFEEYRHPSSIRWSMKQEEARIARVLLSRGKVSYEVLDFYTKL